MREGEFFGFLGPNGAGKTITVKVMSTLTDFQSGNVLINDHDILRESGKAKACIGMIQQTN